MNRSTILHNIINLSISEIVSRLLNFISYIYLARVILAEGFGIISFVIAFSSYFLLIVNFSSDIIASREVARLAHNPPDIGDLQTRHARLADSSPGQVDQRTRQARLESGQSSFVNKIISLRLILACASYALLSGLVLLFCQQATIKAGLLIYGLTFFAQAINISWYFRGTEKTLPVTISQILSSLINLILIVAFVLVRVDIIYAILIMTLVAFVNSLVLLFFYGKGQKMRLILDAGYTDGQKTNLLLDAGFGSEKKGNSILDSGFVRRNLRESFPVALAGLMISIYYNLDHVMLGYMTSSTELGYYAAAYKIIIIALVPAGIVYQAFLPQFSKSKNDPYHIANLMELYSTSMLILGAFFTTIIFLFAKNIIGIAYGTKYGNSIMLTQILAFNIFLVYLNMTYGNPLIAWDKQKVYSYSIIVGALSNIILNLILIPRYYATGAAVATICSELVVMAGIIPTHFVIAKRIHFGAILKSIALMIITITFILYIKDLIG
ncbi:MAG: flippase [Bacteroidetes bacterium]|nr:flippase [Bacteroidota bacterium]